jgi:hypothetical protein
MAEYILSYTAKEIDDNLGLVGKNKENIDKINEDIQFIQEDVSAINEGIVGINENIEGINSSLESKADKEHAHDYADTNHTHPGQESFSTSEPNGQTTGDYWMESY